MATDAYLSFINFERQNIFTKFDKNIGKYYLSLSNENSHLSQAQLNAIYPIRYTYTYKIWFIDSYGQSVACKLTDPPGNYMQLPVHKLEKLYNIDNKFCFMDEGQLHIICGDRYDRLSDTCHHLKYVKQRNIFVKMDDIINKRELLAFSERHFFYNSFQKRLYMIKIRTKFLRISYIDDLNQWENRWKLKNKRKWKTTKKSIAYHGIKIDPLLDRYSNKWSFVVVYDTLLIILIYNKLFWIDLMDLMVYVDEKYISPRQFYRYAHLLNIFDNYLYFISNTSSIWSKFYLPEIMPKKK
eukprot:487961_1